MKSTANNVSVLDTIMPIFEARREISKNNNLSKDELTEQLIKRFFFITILWIAFLAVRRKMGEIFRIG